MKKRETKFISNLHRSTKRNYLARVNLKKPIYMKNAKKYSFDYWDSSREKGYGGYRYIPGRWKTTAKKIIKYYNPKAGSKVLDIGCGKGYLIYEMTKIIPNLEVYGLDISDYAIKNSKEEISHRLIRGNSNKLPFESDYFNLVISINTLHCLNCIDLEKSLMEM